MKTKTTSPSVADFAENLAEFLSEMRQSEMPLVLSVDGEPSLVVFDLRLFQFLAKTGDRELVELLRRRVQALDRGEEQGIPAEKVFADLRRRFRGTKKRGKAAR